MKKLKNYNNYLLSLNFISDNSVFNNNLENEEENEENYGKNEDERALFEDENEEVEYEETKEDNFDDSSYVKVIK
jgi:hypothetical protein